MKTIAVIPARYASTRMPGKPLADVLGKPMIWWVYQAAKACPKLDDVLIATDDERIADACKTYGMRYLMTSPDHDTPTGRIWEVSTVEDADLYLQLMGSPIPYPKGTLDFEYEKVTGIQLYSKQALAFYHATPKSILEKAEENDMMRFIENGHKVHAIVSPYKTVSVDTPKDLALVNTILKEKQHG